MQGLGLCVYDNAGTTDSYSKCRDPVCVYENAGTTDSLFIKMQGPLSLYMRMQGPPTPSLKMQGPLTLFI